MIELRGICFSYQNSGAPGGNPPKDFVLQNVDLRIETGECVLLTGSSGNGKTTLTRVINGLAPSYYGGVLEGSVLIDGKETDGMPPWERARIMGNVFQDPQSQFFSGELAGEIAFACENLGFPAGEIRRRTDAVIGDMRLEYLRHTPLDLVSSGEMQKIAIASVRSLSPGIYVFDEPSANLDEEASIHLAEIFEHLKKLRHTLIIAEHRLSYLMGIADRVVYLEKGRIAAEYTPSELMKLPQEAYRAMGLRSPRHISCPSLPSPGEGIESPADDPAIEVRDISYGVQKKTILSGLSFRAFPGTITAVTGKNGIGKTTLGRLLCGLVRETRGKVFLRGKPQRPGKRNRMVWYSANNTNTQFFTHSVAEEILLLSPGNEDRIETALLKKLGLYERRDSHPTTLSGGQKQRLSLACGIFSDRDVLVFDEPTSGLDGAGLLMVSNCLRETAKRGKTIFIITHDRELIRECCTHCFSLG
jgi:energy-coupling factor transport system ATP-binding protein